jgi:hypothetical protein
MARLEQNRAPAQQLTTQEQQRVIAMVERMWQRRQAPAWVIWTALYRFAATQIWQLQQQKENQ